MSLNNADCRGFGLRIIADLRRLGIFLFFIFISGVCFASEVDIKVNVDKETITIGDRIRYEVSLEYDEGVNVQPPELAINLGEFEIKDYSIELPKKIKPKRWLSKTTYIITTFTTGEYKIPPLLIKYKDSFGSEKEVKSEEIKILVESVKPSESDKDDIRPLKPPAEIKERPKIWPIILSLLLLAAFLVFIYLKRRKKILEKMPPPPPRPPEEIAREALEALLKLKLIEDGRLKEFYIRLSDIIRNYIEGRFRLFALDRTTWELYQEMKAKKIERSHIEKIKDFLEYCDLVKFAKYVPMSKEIEESVEKTKEIVEITTSKEAIGISNSKGVVNQKKIPNHKFQIPDKSQWPNIQ